VRLQETILQSKGLAAGLEACLWYGVDDGALRAGTKRQKNVAGLGWFQHLPVIKEHLNFEKMVNQKKFTRLQI